MSKTATLTLALLFFAFLFTACTADNFSGKPSQADATVLPAAQQDSNWLAQVQDDLASQEYNIRWQEERCAFSSPNRQNNLRISYLEDGFSLAPRVDSLENWKLAYQVQGVYRGEEKVIALSASPSIDLCGSEMEQHFAHGLHIQYENSPRGMRQNFLVDAKPAGTGPLKVRLNSKGSLFPVQKGNGDVVLAEQNPMTGAVTTRVWYKDLVVMDADGHFLPAAMQVAAPTMEAGEWLASIDLVVDDADAHYPLLIDPISTTAAAMVESDQASAQLGRSVSSAGDVNGDGYSDVIVTAQFFDNGQLDEGVAFIYHGSPTGIGTAWDAMLESNQLNGYMNSVATAGDVNADGYSDVIVGIEVLDHGQTDEGVALVYHGSATGLDTTAVTLLECNQGAAHFGQAVACAGDVNGDGYSDVVVGAAQYDNGQMDEGRFYVYHGSALGISSIAATVVESNVTFAQLGNAVASAGDVNQDGYSDVIVGARFYTNGQTSEGAVFIYHGGLGGLNPVAATMMESNWTNAYMGSSVACAGDVNGDGYSDVIVGVPDFSNPQIAEGVAYVYHGSATGIVTPAAVMLERNQNNAHLGCAVASAGDVNGDGYSDVVVGATDYSNGQAYEGVAFVHYGSASGINNTHNATLEADQTIASFGFSVASAGDVNGDGYSDVVVGSNGYDNGQSEEGAAFVYHGAPTGLSLSAGWVQESNQALAWMGGAVACAGDVNADGFSDVIVSATSWDAGLQNVGAVMIYHGSATGLSTNYALQMLGTQAQEGFGYAVGSAGDVNGDGYSDIIVGTDHYTHTQPEEGAAFVYYGSITGISLSNPSMMVHGQNHAYFGRSVATAGDVNGDGYSDVVVGAARLTNGQAVEGGAFVYHGSALGLDTAVAAFVESNHNSYYMGNSVASAGDVNGDGYSDVVVGAAEYDNGLGNEGAAYLFHGGPSGIITIPSLILVGNQGTEYFGASVASAGDINGDGYSDLVVGADGYSNGQLTEGGAFLFLGSASGLNPTVHAVLEINQQSAQFGGAVASAGDVNGDGYGDIIVGAYAYPVGNASMGAAFVYHGSALGMITTAATSYIGDQLGGLYGHAVASAGDVDGDGYSDVLIGQPTYDNGQTDEGRAFLHHGNGGTGLPTKVRQFRPGTFTTVGPGGKTGTQGQVRLSMTGKSFLGRQEGKFVWEYELNGIPQSSAGGLVTNSVAATGMAAVYTPLTGTGVVLFEDLAGMSIPLEYKWRARIRYNPVTAITGQLYGPWYSYKARTPEVPMLGYKPYICGTMTSAATAATNACGYEVSCPGGNDGSATVVASGGCQGYSYLWSTGDTTSTVTGLATGTYTVTVTSGFGQSSVSTVTLGTAPPVQVTGVVVPTCAGSSDGSINLSVAGGNGCHGYTYQWSTGANTSYAVGLAAGTYTVTVTDMEGCTATQSFTVIALPLPQPSFTQVGNLLTSTQTWSSYQWLLNGGNIPGANGNTYSISQSGSYSLSVTDTNGCVGVSSPSIITGIGQAMREWDALMLLPNPARGEFRLRSPSPITMPLRVTVSDMYGKGVFSMLLPALDYELSFDIRTLATGTYWVAVEGDAEMRRVFRLVVQ